MCLETDEWVQPCTRTVGRSSRPGITLYDRGRPSNTTLPAANAQSGSHAAALRFGVCPLLQNFPLSFFHSDLGGMVSMASQCSTTLPPSTRKRS